MKPSRLFRHLDDLPENLRHGVVMIGNFDGVHLGHRQLVESLVATARRESRPAVVFTFDPHPAHILRPDQVPPALTWLERKAELLLELGVDGVVAFPTDQEFLDMDAQSFFEKVIRQRLGAVAMVEGANFHFGRERFGDIGALCEWTTEAGIGLQIVEPVKVDGHMVSSTRIRQFLVEGKIAEANRLLGRPHRIRGTVVVGHKRGRTLGFPTANLLEIDTILPNEGTYAGEAWIPWKSGDAGDASKKWPCAINLGACPTFDVAHRRFEAHLIDFDGDLYGEVLEVDFYDKLREIKRFESSDQLIEQMHRDIADTRRIVSQPD